MRNNTCDWGGREAGRWSGEEGTNKQSGWCRCSASRTNKPGFVRRITKEIVNDVCFLKKKESQAFSTSAKVDEVAGGKKLLLDKLYLKIHYSFPAA